MENTLAQIKIGQPAHRALQSIGCESLEGLTQYTEKELMALHGFGPKALKILKEVLFEKGLTFKA